MVNMELLKDKEGNRCRRPKKHKLHRKGLALHQDCLGHCLVAGVGFFIPEEIKSIRRGQMVGCMTCQQLNDFCAVPSAQCCYTEREKLVNQPGLVEILYQGQVSFHRWKHEREPRGRCVDGDHPKNGKDLALDHGLVKVSQVRRHVPHRNKARQEAKGPSQLINHEMILYPELGVGIPNVASDLGLYLPNFFLDLLLCRDHRLVQNVKCLIQLLGNGLFRCVEFFLHSFLRLPYFCAQRKQLLQNIFIGHGVIEFVNHSCVMSHCDLESGNVPLILRKAFR
mmetsp:Transcript_20285/g.46969  ORF Transcript_20285/g.46969 Transcript_20285/m.46969 type:complete len:281 (+) Transcript_20285:1921-2763(+)